MAEMQINFQAMDHSPKLTRMEGTLEGGVSFMRGAGPGRHTISVGSPVFINMYGFFEDGTEGDIGARSPHKDLAEKYSKGLEFTVTDPTVISIDQTGKIIGQKFGEADITITHRDIPNESFVFYFRANAARE